MNGDGWTFYSTPFAAKPGRSPGWTMSKELGSRHGRRTNHLLTTGR